MRKLLFQFHVVTLLSSISTLQLPVTVLEIFHPSPLVLKIDIEKTPPFQNPIISNSPRLEITPSNKLQLQMNTHPPIHNSRYLTRHSRHTPCAPNPGAESERLQVKNVSPPNIYMHHRRGVHTCPHLLHQALTSSHAWNVKYSGFLPLVEEEVPRRNDIPILSLLLITFNPFKSRVSALLKFFLKILENLKEDNRPLIGRGCMPTCA